MSQEQKSIFFPLDWNDDSLAGRHLRLCPVCGWKQGLDLKLISNGKESTNA